MDIVQQGRDLQKKLDQLEQNVMERRNVAMAQEQEQKVRLESLKNQTKEQQEILQNNKRELNVLCELERNKKLSIEQLNQQILIKTKKIEELGQQEVVKKQQLEEVVQKVESQKRMLEELESQAQKIAETWKSNFDNLEQDWNCRVAEINAEEERRLKKVYFIEDKERTLRIEIAQKETEKRETTRKECEQELEKVKKSIAEGYAKLKKILKQTNFVQNFHYLQHRVPMPFYQQLPPIQPNQSTSSFNPILSDSPVEVEQSVSQPIIPNQTIQSGLISQPSSSALPAQPSQLVGQFYIQQKFQRQRLMVQDELIRRAVPAVNSNLPNHLSPPVATTAGSDSSINTTTTASQTDVIPEMVQSSSSPSESTTSCPVPVNPINIDIDQRPNSNNGFSVICYAPSSSTLAPTVTAVTFPPISTVASTSDNYSTTASKLISSATTSTLSNYASLSPVISTLADCSTSTSPSFPANLDKSLNLNNGIEIITIDDSDDDVEKEEEKMANLDYASVKPIDNFENKPTDIDNSLTSESNGRNCVESPEKRERRLAQKRQWQKQRRANETPEQRKHRLAFQRECNKQRRANETPEQRERRLKDQNKRHKRKISNETPEQRKLKLAKARQSNSTTTNTTVKMECRILASMSRTTTTRRPIE